MWCKFGLLPLQFEGGEPHVTRRVNSRRRYTRKNERGEEEEDEEEEEDVKNVKDSCWCGVLLPDSDFGIPGWGLG